MSVERWWLVKPHRRHAAWLGPAALAARSLRGLAEVRADNAQGEYYMTDTLEILLRRGRRVVARVCRNPREVLGVNTLEQLREVEAIMKERLRHA